MNLVIPRRIDDGDNDRLSQNKDQRTGTEQFAIEPHFHLNQSRGLRNMRMDFDRVGRLASTAFDFVREQSKKSLNEFSKTATRLFKNFLGLSGYSTKAVTGVLDFSKHGYPGSIAFSDQELSNFSEHLEAQKESLLGDLGLLIDEDKLQQLEGSVDKHPDGLRLNNDMIVHGIGSEEGVSGGSRRFMSVSIPHVAEPLMVPVTVLKRSSSHEEITGHLFAHLERTSRCDWGHHGPAMFCGGGNQAQLDDLAFGVKALRRTQSMPNLNPEQGGEGLRRVSSAPDFMRFEPDSPRGETNAALPELTLEGKSPAQVPTTENGLVYRQPQVVDMHCGVMAVNGFFQTKVIDAGDLVRSIIQEDPSLMSNNPHGGAFHPTLMKSFLKSNHAVQIDQQSFSTGTFREFASDDKSLTDQWNRFDSVLRGWSPAEHQTSARTLEVSPGHWLTARGGTEAEPMIRTVNQLLDSRLTNRETQDAWKGYPSEVGSVVPLDTAAPDWSAFSNLLNNSSVDRMLCYTMQGRHWFAMVKSANGQWLRLDQLRLTNASDERGAICSVESEHQVNREGFGQQLADWHVIEVICDQALAQNYWNHL